MALDVGDRALNSHCHIIPIVIPLLMVKSHYCPIHIRLIFNVFLYIVGYIM